MQPDSPTDFLICHMDQVTAMALTEADKLLTRYGTPSRPPSS